MTRGRPITEQAVAEIRRLKDSKKSGREIAEITGISRSTVDAVLARKGRFAATPRPPGQLPIKPPPPPACGQVRLPHQLVAEVRRLRRVECAGIAQIAAATGLPRPVVLNILHDQYRGRYRIYDSLARRTRVMRPAELYQAIRAEAGACWPTIETIEFARRPDLKKQRVYTLTFVTNQELDLGLMEAAYTLGIVAAHEARGEKRPTLPGAHDTEPGRSAVEEEAA